MDPRGGAGLGYFAGEPSAHPAFRDLGRQLTSAGRDSAVLADMMAIARHRPWSIVKARGSPAFRREAWIAGRMAGLEVRGWRPTQRDLRLLAQRTEALAIEAAADGPLRQTDRAARRSYPSAPRRTEGSKALFAVIETMVRRRIADPKAQEQVLRQVQTHIDSWLQRGARFEVEAQREVFETRRGERESLRPGSATTSVWRVR